MHLGGQAGQRGYAMAAVLVGVAVMGIVMTALLPVWRQQAQREKEAELLFRGAQYARAIALYRAKNGNNFPPNLDILVQQRFLRKKFKDPITGEDFQPLFVGQQQTQTGAGGAGRVGGVGGVQNPPGGRGVQNPPGGRGGQTPMGGAGITSVVSKSKETSIRNHRGATTYNQWQFTPMDDINGPGAPQVGRGGMPGMESPGQQFPGDGRGGRGSPVPGGGRGIGGPGGRGVGEGGRGFGGGGRGFGSVPGGRGM